MKTQNRKLHLLMATLVLLCATSSEAKPRKMQSVQPGTWGGPHIRIDVSRISATIEYDCAHGTIDGPLKVDLRGGFSFTGTYSREHGGPIRDNESSSNQPARYTGTIHGQTMNLTVRLAGTNEVIGTFLLVRGNASRIFKCR